MLPLPLLLSVIAGCLIALLVSAPFLHRSSVRRTECKNELARVCAERDGMRADYDQVREALASVREERARLQAQLEAERSAAQRSAAVLQDLESRFKEAFSAISSQALQANNQAFLDLAKASLGEFQQAAKGDLDARQQSIDQIVGSVRDGLTRVDDTLREFDRSRVASHAVLQQHLTILSESQQRLTQETESLVRALRSPQGRGQWGEMQLRRVIELAGMLEHCDFIEQQAVHTDDGRLRPDVIVHLPREKCVVVDSKAPLDAYLDAFEATDEGERVRQLDRHAKQVRDHIERLATKEYADQFANSPNFVLMFLPGEAFFSAACQRDPSLIEYAASRGVVPASPTTLITMLKAVAYGWDQERIAQNAEAIRDAGMDLYARMGVVAEHLAKIRKGLETAVTAYNSAIGSLESRVLPPARKLRELGAGSGEEIEPLEPVSSLPRLPVAPELVFDSPVERRLVGAAD